jgi:hypothetical protein
VFERSGESRSREQVFHGEKFEAKLFVRAGETQGVLRVLLVERAEREHDHDVHEDVRTDEKVSAGGEKSWIQRDSDSWANVAAEKARRVE